MEDFITLNCPSCGGKLEVGKNTSILKCYHCGSEHLVRREDGAVKLESYARCPMCGRNDRVEKVTAILRSHPEDSGLAISLAPPERPAKTPKPQPLPRPKALPIPEKTPRPSLKAKPKPIAKSILEYKKKNNWMIVGGVFLFVISYFLFFGSIGVSINEGESQYAIYGGVTLIPLGFGIFLFYKGQNWKKIPVNDADSIKEYLLQKPKNPEKQKTKFIVLSTVFFVAAVILCLISFLVLSEMVGGSVLFLGLSFLPALFGTYFLFRVRSIIKHGGQSFPSPEKLELALKKMEEENIKILTNAVQENDRLIREWEEENKKIYDSWENENRRLFEEWKKENVRIPQYYRDVMERWDELYFCYRDDVVFIPGEGTYAPVEKMRDYLQE